VLLCVCLFLYGSYAYVDCVGNGFAIAPRAEFPYAYKLYVNVLSWPASRQACKSFHPNCDLAVSRNLATLALLQKLGDETTRHYFGSICGYYWFGLRQLNTSSNPQGGWYWVDGVGFDPQNSSDERWYSGSSGLPSSGLGSAANLRYVTNGSTSAVVCNYWSADSFSDTTAWSFWELPSKFTLFLKKRIDKI
jgi:hypothetical protein